MLAFCTASDLLDHPLPLPRTHNNKIETVALEAQRGNINHGKSHFTAIPNRNPPQRPSKRGGTHELGLNLAT